MHQQPEVQATSTRKFITHNASTTEKWISITEEWITSLSTESPDKAGRRTVVDLLRLGNHIQQLSLVEDFH